MPARWRPRTSPPTGEFRLYCVWEGFGPDEGCPNLAERHWHRDRHRQRLYCQRHRKHVARLKHGGRVRGYRTGDWLVRVGPGRGDPRRGWRRQARVIVEQELGRPLTDDEKVILRDRNPDNLARSNIWLLPRRVQYLRLLAGRARG